MNKTMSLQITRVYPSAHSDKVCPVCGYDNLALPPKDYMTCPCCRTEFGYDDFNATHAELRQEWIADGCKWHSTRTLPPEGWNPIEQMRRAGFMDREENPAVVVVGTNWQGLYRVNVNQVGTTLSLSPMLTRPVRFVSKRTSHTQTLCFV